LCPTLCLDAEGGLKQNSIVLPTENQVELEKAKIFFSSSMSWAHKREAKGALKPV
jgi:hypothetical protein